MEPTASIAGNGAHPEDRRKIAKDIQKCLDNIDSESSFAAQGTLGEVNPGLYIDDLGAIGMPISEHDVHRIINESRQAPFGKGSETIVDTSIRNTWEIDAARIHFRHPSWTKIQQAAFELVCTQLGVDSQYAEAQLYKLLIYDKGAKFLPHKDTEKAPGMFGTLVICLPSKHEGGDVVVTFQRRTATMQTWPTSEWSSSFLAWYSDVLHEVKPVTSGHRVVLTYNLVNLCAKAPTIVDTDKQIEAIKQSLCRWSNLLRQPNNEAIPRYLLYLLEHEYTDASLSLDAMKGNDVGRARYLASVLKETNFVCFLATVERTVRGGCEDDDNDDDYQSYGRRRGRKRQLFERLYDAKKDTGMHEITEVVDDYIKLKRIYRLEGSKVIDGVKISEQDIIQDAPFARDPDGESYEGFTGNAGASAVQWYTETALLIMPRWHWLDYIVKSLQDCKFTGSRTSEVVDLVKHEAKRFRMEPTNDNARQELVDLCSRLMSAKNRQPANNNHPDYWDVAKFEDPAMCEIANCGALIGDYDLFERALATVKKPSPQFYTEMVQVAAGSTFAMLRSVFERAMRSVSGFDGQLAAIDGLVTACLTRFPDEIDSISTWRTAQLKSSLMTASKLNQSALGPLIEVLSATPETEIQQLALTLAHNNPAFRVMLDLSQDLCLAIREDKIDQRKATVAIGSMLSPVLSIFVLEPPKHPKHPSHNLAYMRSLGWPGASSNTIGKDELISIHRMMIILDLALEGSLITGLKANMEVMALECFHSILLPYLADLVVLMRQCEIGSTDPKYRELFRAVVDGYTHRFVQKEPKRTHYWPPRPGCRCEDCATLDSYLQDDTSQTIGFRMNVERRMHIEGRFLPYIHPGYPQIGPVLPDYELSTDRRRNPHTLSVKKIHGAWSLAMHNLWQKRALEAKEILLALGPLEDLCALTGRNLETINLHQDDIAPVTQPGPLEQSLQTKRPLEDPAENDRPLKRTAVQVVDLSDSP